MKRKASKGGRRREGEAMPDLPYTMKLPDGRTLFVEAPANPFLPS